jgi:hypothetical protein
LTVLYFYGRKIYIKKEQNMEGIEQRKAHTTNSEVCKKIKINTQGNWQKSMCEESMLAYRRRRRNVIFAGGGGGGVFSLHFRRLEQSNGPGPLTNVSRNNLTCLAVIFSLQ